MRIGCSGIVKYGFAVGRVRVLETRMVSAARIKRLIEAENLEEAHRVLAETEYGPEMRTAETIEQMERALERQLNRAYSLLSESNLPPELETYFRSRHDILNLRILLKRAFGHRIDVDLSVLGEVPVKIMEASVESRNFDRLPAYLGNAARETIAKFEANRRFEEMDAILDRSYFDNLLFAAGKLKSKWITAYTKLIIDLADGRVAVRSAAALDRPAVAEYDLAADRKAAEWLAVGGSFDVGPEPVFAYVSGMEHEVKVVRLILFSHLSGVRPARIRERVGSIHV